MGYLKGLLINEEDFTNLQCENEQLRKQLQEATKENEVLKMQIDVIGSEEG